MAIPVPAPIASFRRSTVILILTTAVSAIPLAAQQHGLDATIAIRAGTLGLGVEAAKLVTGNIGLRVGANFLKVSGSGDNSNVNYEVEAKLHGLEALVDLFPKSRGSFHLTGGVITKPAELDLTGKPTTAGSYTINHNLYSTGQVGTLTGEGSFKTGPYAGLGFGTPAGKGGSVKFRFDIGAVFGQPTVTLTSTGAQSNPTLASDLAAQAATTQQDVRKNLKFFPVVSLGLAVHL